MADMIDDLTESLSSAENLLLSTGEISLASIVSDIHRKTILLSAASLFEQKLTNDVLKFVSEIEGGEGVLTSIVKNKAVSRQYHAWFDWDKPNANKFFSMFGNPFSKWINECLKKDDALSQSVKDFLSLGGDRNRLVHQNYSAFVLEASAAEIMERYRSATIFVEQFPIKLAEYYHIGNHKEAVA